MLKSCLHAIQSLHIAHKKIKKGKGKMRKKVSAALEQETTLLDDLSMFVLSLLYWWAELDSKGRKKDDNR